MEKGERDDDFPRARIERRASFNEEAAGVPTWNDPRYQRTMTSSAVSVSDTHSANVDKRREECEYIGMTIIVPRVSSGYDEWRT